jgi:hypothetical protein
VSVKAKYAAILVTLLLFVAGFIWAGEPSEGATEKGDPCPDATTITASEWGRVVNRVEISAKEARTVLGGVGYREPGHPHMRVYDICGHPNAYLAEARFWFNHGKLVYGAWIVVTFHDGIPNNGIRVLTA